MSKLKKMSEIFEGLAIIGDAVSQEDRVVHLLASLPEPYDYTWGWIRQDSWTGTCYWKVKLLHQESKLKEKVPALLEDGRKALTAGQN